MEKLTIFQGSAPLELASTMRSALPRIESIKATKCDAALKTSSVA
jgi:hypothetical protein